MNKDSDKQVVASGVHGPNKKPFTKRFKDEAAYEKWRDSDAAEQYQVDTVMNESAVTMKYYNVYETVDGKKIPFAHKIYSDDQTAIAEGRRIVAESGYRNFAVYEGYKELPPIDAERYDSIPGMEGPFRTLSGHVVYYDPKEGEYYDRDRDMYIDRDEFRDMDTDYSNMKDERDIPVREGERHGNSKIYDKCWDGYKRVPGKKRGEKGSCVKETDTKSTVEEGIAEFAHHADRDHEVQMARSDLYKLAEYSIKLHNMLRNVSEEQGIEGWQQAKITKAADYISSVYHRLKYDQESASPAVTEGDVVNFSSFAGMYSDGARATFTGQDGKPHTLTATGDSPRKFYIDGKETSWDNVKRIVGNQRLHPRQGMNESKSKLNEMFGKVHPVLKKELGVHGDHAIGMADSDKGVAVQFDRPKNTSELLKQMSKYGYKNVTAAGNHKNTYHFSESAVNEAKKTKPGHNMRVHQKNLDKLKKTTDKTKTNEATTAGGVATVSQPLGKMQKRRKNR